MINMYNCISNKFTKYTAFMISIYIPLVDILDLPNVW